MSKFQSTVSTVAALCSIFGVAAAGWKVAESKHTYDSQQETIRELQSKLEAEEKIEPVEPVIAPTLPPPQVQVQAPPVPQLPEPPPIQEQEAPSPPLPTTP